MTIATRKQGRGRRRLGEVGHALLLGFGLGACHGDDAADAIDDASSEGTTVASDPGDDPTSAGDNGDDTSTGEPADECAGPPSVGPQPLRRLTRAHLQAAIVELLGVEIDEADFEGDERVGAFASNLTAPVSTNGVHQLRIAAETAAEAGLGAIVAALPCDPTIDVGCTEAWLASFGRRAFRRSLTADERARYLGLAEAGDDPIDGIRLVVTALLQSPHFLYVVEPLAEGDEPAPLGGAPLATRMSLFLWSSIPDLALLDAAEAGELDTAEGIRAQAERMLDDPRARAAIASFHTQWLDITEVAAATKDPAVYPDFDAALGAAMRTETERFAEAVVLHGDGRLATLLTADWSYLDADLAALYGVAFEGPGAPTSLDPTERSGLLTHASFLASHAHADQSGPVQRGVVVLSNLLCNPPPPPPPDVNAQPPSPEPDATTRERFAQHTADPACAGCHVRIDGIGLGFEAYDGIGRHRTTENGLPIDESGELLGTDVDGPFDGVVELSARLAESAQVRECTARQWLRFSLGRNEADGDACTVTGLVDAFEATGGDIRSLMLDIVTSDGFRRKAPEEA